MASQLARGHVDIDDFTDAAIRDDAVLALTRRITYREDPHNDYPRHFGGWIRIHLRDGRSLEHHEPINRGHADKPLSDDDVRDKFRRNAMRVLSAAQAEQAVRAVAELDDAADLGGVVRAVGVAA